MFAVPDGYVCNQCNNYFGANVDHYFYGVELGLMRALTGMPTRRGKPTTLSGPGYSIGADAVFGRTIQIAHSNAPPLTVRVNEETHELTLSLTLSERNKPWLTSAYLSKLLVEFGLWQQEHPEAVVDKSRPTPVLPDHARNARQPSPSRFIPFAHRFVPGQERLVVIGTPVSGQHVAFRFQIAARDFLLAWDPSDSLEWASLLGYFVVRPS